jgi:drug/metabolite transporter (DMT)-like permease
MSIPPWAAAAIAVSGNFVLSFGMSLQKRHIAWIGRSPGHPPWRGHWDASFYRDFSLWFLGFTLMNVVSVFTFFALMGLSTNVVSAITGTSVAFTAILAKLMLKERLGGRRLAWTIALFAAIAVAGFLGEGGSSGAERFSPPALYAFFCAPFAVGCLLFALRRGRFKGPRLAAAIAAASGAVGGFMLFPMRAIQVAAAPGIWGALASPYLYAYLAAGAWSFILIQAAYKDGEMAAVAPALYGMQVLWPAIGSHYVFGAPFRPAQSAAFVGVALCVAAIAGFHSTVRSVKADRDADI